jgi:hypothetical protein
VKSAYLKLVNATLIVYFIPFLYMFAAAIRLERQIAATPGAVPVPGGRAGSLFWNGLGFLTTLVAIVLALIPPADTADKGAFFFQVAGGAVGFAVLGWIFYWLATRKGSRVPDEPAAETRSRRRRSSFRPSAAPPPPAGVLRPRARPGSMCGRPLLPRPIRCWSRSM